MGKSGGQEVQSGGLAACLGRRPLESLDYGKVSMRRRTLSPGRLPGRHAAMWHRALNRLPPQLESVCWLGCELVGLVDEWRGRDGPRARAARLFGLKVAGEATSLAGARPGRASGTQLRACRHRQLQAQQGALRLFRP